MCRQTRGSASVLPCIVTSAAAARAPESLLRAIAECRDPEARDELCAAMIRDHALPLARRIIGSRLGIYSAEADDVIADVSMRLLRRLRRLNAEGTIDSFAGYVAITAHHAIDDRLRKRYPNQTLLRNRLRYLLTHDARFALWSCGERLACGFANWKGEMPRAKPNAMLDGDALAESVAETFARAGGPMLLDALMKALPQVDEEPPPSDEADDAPSALDRLSARELLARLWNEIEELPLRQRIALVLSLRDDDGGSAVPLLPLAGINHDRIARALALDGAELEAIWNALPLDDLTIAARLSVTRQQVINLRKAARARLARRMQRW